MDSLAVSDSQRVVRSFQPQKTPKSASQPSSDIRAVPGSST